MSSIKVPDIKAGDRFWHDGGLYTAYGDARRTEREAWWDIPLAIGFLTLHRGGAVLRAGWGDER